MNRQLAKLSKTLGGIKDMRGLPELIFVVDQAKKKSLSKKLTN